jgi:hypothetical protein
MIKITSALWVVCVVAACLLSYLTGHGETLRWSSDPYYNVAVFLSVAVMMLGIAVAACHAAKVSQDVRVQTTAALIEMPVGLFAGWFLMLWLFPNL